MGCNARHPGRDEPPVTSDVPDTPPDDDDCAQGAPAAEEGEAPAADWEARVMRRIATHVDEVLATGDTLEERAGEFGWESRGLEHLARRLRGKPPSS
jgi:hypothetical protein